MINLTLAEIEFAVKGNLELGNSLLSRESEISSTSQTDSREISRGDIFFARRGEETDGHLFIEKAIQNGATLVIAERVMSDEVAHIVVKDTTEALGALATETVRRVLEITDMQIVGITGSNGKTTTKNLVGKMLETHGNTVASEKSFNNEVGGPLTALRINEQTKYLVAEMGASAEGEIARLVKMAPPHISVVLNVGFAHEGEFGGIEATFRTKSEMVTALPKTATAVLNIDDPRVAQMKDLTEARIVWFGLTDRADVWAENIVASAEGTRFVLHIRDQKVDVAFGVLGEHHVMNALAASAVATELGVDISQIAKVLESTTRPAKWRMEVARLANNITLINDAYNASPDSMQAALKTLIQVKQPPGRAIAVLGTMSELGESSGEHHDRIGLLAVRLGIDELVVIGPEARRLHISAINEGAWNGESVFFETQAKAKEYLLETLRPSDTVIIKSSNSAGLRFLGDELKEALA